MKIKVSSPSNGNNRHNNKQHEPRFTGRNPSIDAALEPRYFGEWEAEVKVRRLTHSAPRRKVVTIGTRVIKNSELVRSIVSMMRRGYEVRLVENEMESGIRLFPCMKTDFSGMFIAAQTIGDFRESIGDIKYTIKAGRKHEEISSSEAAKITDDGNEKHRERYARGAEVTPDVMVTCPNCGEEFRVGRKNG